MPDGGKASKTNKIVMSVWPEKKYVDQSTVFLFRPKSERDPVVTGSFVRKAIIAADCLFNKIK
jgi:hypothetical protein